MTNNEAYLMGRITGLQAGLLTIGAAALTQRHAREFAVSRLEELQDDAPKTIQSIKEDPLIKLSDEATERLQEGMIECLSILLKGINVGL